MQPVAGRLPNTLVSTPRAHLPLLAPQLLTPPNVAQAHEISPVSLADCDVYCDYRATTPSTAGEMVLANQQHGWDASSVKGDLAELVAGTCALPDRSKTVFFRSVGLGLEDIAMAAAVHDSLEQQ